MTNEEAISVFKEWIEHDKKMKYADRLENIEIYNMAIKALEQQPCEDAISREAVNSLIDELARAISDKRCYISRGRATSTIMQDILDLPPVTPKAKWIPVSERLPEEGEPILFSTKTGRVYEGAYFDLSDNRQWYAYEDENYAWNNVVTAWMPLPQPYKAEGENKEGKWIEVWDKDRLTILAYKCSECGTMRNAKTSYCADCGADMRGDSE